MDKYNILTQKSFIQHCSFPCTFHHVWYHLLFRIHHLVTLLSVPEPRLTTTETPGWFATLTRISMSVSRTMTSRRVTRSWSTSRSRLVDCWSVSRTCSLTSTRDCGGFATGPALDCGCSGIGLWLVWTPGSTEASETGEMDRKPKSCGAWSDGGSTQGGGEWIGYW